MLFVNDQMAMGALQALELLVQRLADPARPPVSLEPPVSVTRRAGCGCG